ncbi:MAG: hypothetical protein ACYTX0_47485 [Nostoc sp.]
MISYFPPEPNQLTSYSCRDAIAPSHPYSCSIFTPATSIITLVIGTSRPTVARAIASPNQAFT